MAAEKLGIYSALSKLGALSYRGKIMMVAFLGTHVPLLALMVWALNSSNGLSRSELYTVIGVALIATLVGTGATLHFLNRLLRPISLASTALQNYATRNELPDLPTGYHDEAGRLMSQTHHVLRLLDASRRELAERDATTGLPNQTQFLRILGERLEREPRAFLAVSVLEISNLDEIVTLFGQRRADAILRGCIERLERIMASVGVLGRVRSNQLGCLLTCADKEVGLQLTRDLLASLGEDSGKDMPFRLSGCAGVSFHPEDGSGAATQLENAMAAVESASRQSLSLVVHSETHRDQLLEHYTLERDLRQAILGDQLELYYQPVYDTQKQRVTAAEALIRWKHPERGILLPGSFIAFAESVGLIEQLGRWTLEQVCRQMSLWRNSPMANIRIAFNLSARQFSDPDLVATLRKVTQRYGIDASLLEIEITESSAMDDVQRAGTILAQLRELGVRVAIDDFGTGYSSLSYLRTLPLSKLKIDREFVQGVDTNTDHRAIAQALIALTRELELDVLAEGVETSAEVHTLHSLGCHLFQGYYFARPQPVLEFERLIVQEEAAPRFPEIA